MPHEIDDSEILCRSVNSLHGSKKKLHWKVFVHPDDEVSVSRAFWVPFWLERFRSRALLTDRAAVPPIEVVGYAFFSAAAARALASTLADTRSVYIGHVDLSLGFKSPRQEPLPSPLKKERDDRARLLRDRCWAAFEPIRSADMSYGKISENVMSRATAQPNP